MADWRGVLRTNYVRTKDRDAFKAWVARFPTLTFIENDGGKVGFYNDDDGYVPSSKVEGVVFDESGAVVDEEFVDLEGDQFWDELCEHLREEDLLIVMQSGAENTRYVSGLSLLVTSDGIQEKIFLSDIYDVAKEKYPDLILTVAEY